MENWDPCYRLDHKWESLGEYGYRCAVCGAVGWENHKSAFGKTVATFVHKIFPYICPICKGATDMAYEACPTCRVKKEEISSLRCRRKAIHVWDDLSPSQKIFISYLAEQNEPVCVSRSNGSGSASFLSRHGFVKRGGLSSGQTKWVLTDKGRELFLGSIGK